MSYDRLPGDPENCSVCGFKTHRHMQPGYVSDLYCSGFCSSTSVEEKAKLPNLKPGDFGVFPCYCCGEAVEDEYREKEICGECGDRIRDMKRGRRMVATPIRSFEGVAKEALRQGRV